LSGTVISEDMTKAKELFKDKIREVRKPLLEAEDVTYMRAIESNDSDGRVIVEPDKLIPPHLEYLDSDEV